MPTKKKPTNRKSTKKQATDVKKITTFFVSGLVGLAIFSGEITLLQILPFVIFAVLAYQDIWKNISRKEIIISFALVMAVLNTVIAFEDVSAFLDTIIWSLIAYVFWKH